MITEESSFHTVTVGPAPRSQDGDDFWLNYTVKLAWKARRSGRHPFGAVVVAADGTVLSEGENYSAPLHLSTGAKSYTESAQASSTPSTAPNSETPTHAASLLDGTPLPPPAGPDPDTVPRDATRHAEVEAIRAASARFGGDPTNPVLQGATLFANGGSLYWSGIGRLAYGISEAKIKQFTGAENPENPTLDVSCRKILQGGGARVVDVVGPRELPGMDEVQEGFWL
ncbi:hypothetical protein HDU93_007176 [Gonapodya sp. JEL0774]|nr:hypothetical protein HDU93_007176 [Gonapodya sp. JEL0774]